MRKSLFILFIFSAFALTSQAQELNCQINVIFPQIQGVNTAIFEQMESDIFEFMNNKQWTNDKFSIEERIECSIVINITEARASSNTYRAEMQVVSTRPVYGSDYHTPILNIRDVNLTFDYFQNTQYNFNPDQFKNNLVSTLAFYAYMIIGYDYDTFSVKGGTAYYQQAQRIVQSAQVSNFEGWKAFEGDKNRYWLVEDILHRTFDPMRQTLYSYHREGLDMMSEKMRPARQAIMNSLKNFEQVHSVKPLAYNTQQFFLAKSDEIVNLFSEADPPERNQVYEVVAKVDPGNLAKYEKMQKGK